MGAACEQVYSEHLIRGSWGRRSTLDLLQELLLPAGAAVQVTAGEAIPIVMLAWEQWRSCPSGLLLSPPCHVPWFTADFAFPCVEPSLQHPFQVESASFQAIEKPCIPYGISLCFVSFLYPRLSFLLNYVAFSKS